MSVLLEFDPDERDFSTRSSNTSKGWRNIRVNKGVFPKSGEELLYLTDAPHCSSLLKPSLEDIANWLFRDLFSVSDTHTVEVVSLSQALDEYAVRGIDFLKLDTQGLDLDIVRSLDQQTLRQISLLELEPGLAPIYTGESRVVDVLAFMDKQPFWLSHFGPQGVSRTRQYGIHDKHLFRYALQLAAAKGAVWATMRYLNTCADGPLNRRLLLTTWLAAMLTGHFGYALDLVALGR